MHELSIAESLVAMVTHEARRANATRVERVVVRLGALAGVDPEALAFCFPVAARGTPADGADLHIDLAPATGACPACGCRCPVHALMDGCPDCGGWPLHVEGGREMTLSCMEVC